MPSLSVQRQPHALMAIDMNPNRDNSFDNMDDIGPETGERERKGGVRIKTHQRVRSYQQLLEDFREQDRAVRPEERGLPSKTAAQNQFGNAAGMDGDTSENVRNEDAEREEKGEEDDYVDLFYTPTHSRVSSPVSSPRKQHRKEDTARRSKRFSLPAIGLHTTVVTARTSIEGEDVAVTGGVKVLGEEGEGVVTGLSKRFSLVLAGRHGHTGNASIVQDDGVLSDLGLGKGLAAARLSELLGRTTRT